ncbi:unnamed protein product [Schistosoma margrebowiei]|uniref:Uncharacterized protein n=1 Tax=Schistosoma margrebowiei TaxID=48269 RepID=A0A183MY60_9TREM|nr:unnamed protein product [Schistosoma margrebowiei]
MAIRQIKSGKAAEPDNVQTEALNNFKKPTTAEKQKHFCKLAGPLKVYMVSDLESISQQHKHMFSLFYETSNNHFFYIQMRITDQ